MASQSWDGDRNLVLPLSQSSNLTPVLTRPMTTTTLPLHNSQGMRVDVNHEAFQVAPFQPSAISSGSAAQVPLLSSDVNLALDAVIEYIIASEPLSSFDYLCFEHLRKRILGSESSIMVH